MLMAMASFASTSNLLSYVLLLILVSIATTQMLSRFSTDILTHRFLENWDRWNRDVNQEKQKPMKTLTKIVPQTRRFLFSPTIQNTITNLNQNSNLQEGSISEGNESKQIYAFMNPRSGALEYDIKASRPRKICFTFE